MVENPKVSAIEILPLTASPGQLGASPASVVFGTVLVGQSANQNVVLTNLGGSSDPSVVVDATTITGVNASEFTDSFNDASSLTLAPGQSTTIAVQFAPTSGGAKSAALEIVHSGNNSPITVAIQGSSSTSQQVGFGKSVVAGTVFNDSFDYPTSLDFGPDGRLYVAHQNGLIRVYAVQRTAQNSYSVVSMESIASINSVPNHDDDATPNATLNTRLITGLLVSGTAANPVIYVGHSDPRIGGGPEGQDLNLDTNSSMISRLRWTGSTWEHLDLVRGLPRSEENHAANGMQLDAVNNILYVAMGGNTNKGAPSFNFAYLPEFALSAAILSIDLNAIGSTTYDLPTLDDETRPGNPDPGDPFGGNSGRNQAVIVPGGPVQVYAPGFRNPYDLVITESGRMYTIDNGGNAAWGDTPVGAGPAGTCTNDPNEPGTTSPDTLHFVSGQGYYGGHPNPTRGNMANTFNTSNPQSPVSAPNPIECDYREAGSQSGAITVFVESTNGLTEYTTENFGGAMKGNLIMASFDGNVHRVQLDSPGGRAIAAGPLFTAAGMLPLDVVALGQNSAYPGTIWVALYGTGQIVVFEPNDFEGGSSSCTGVYDAALDEDEDGYNNKDEIDSGTNPCSGADVPPDADGDHISDLNDSDDDSDGIPDQIDPFPLDQFNGFATRLPISYLWENDGSNPGGILNLGFTGLMINGASNYRTLYRSNEMTAGGAAGVLTVDKVSEGDAFGSLNNQEYGFQFGVWARPDGYGAVPRAHPHPRAILRADARRRSIDGAVRWRRRSGQLREDRRVGDRRRPDRISHGDRWGRRFGDFDAGRAAGPQLHRSLSPGRSHWRHDPAVLLGCVRRCHESANSAGGRAECSERLVHESGVGSGDRHHLDVPWTQPEFPATWDFIRAIPDTAGPGTTVVYRVNAGGPAVSGTPNWSDDTGSPPSSYVNAETIGNNVYTTSSAVNSSHPSIPAGTPPSVFTSERYNPAENAPMQWSFPVTPGTYEVRLYFAEIWFTSSGARTFNVSIEGTQVLTGYDIVADVGAFTGVMKSFTVTADSSLDIGTQRGSGESQGQRDRDSRGRRLKFGLRERLLSMCAAGAGLGAIVAQHAAVSRRAAYSY